MKLSCWLFLAEQKLNFVKPVIKNDDLSQFQQFHIRDNYAMSWYTFLYVFHDLVVLGCHFDAANSNSAYFGWIILVVVVHILSVSHTSLSLVPLSLEVLWHGYLSNDFRLLSDKTILVLGSHNRTLKLWSKMLWKLYERLLFKVSCNL